MTLIPRGFVTLWPGMRLGMVVRMPSLLRNARLPFVLSLLLTTYPGVARAEPWFGLGDHRLEGLYEDGDIDVEDLVEGSHVGRSRGGSQQVRAGTWLTLGGFGREVDGKVDLGVLVIFGGAFDRLAEGRVHDLARTESHAGFAASPLADGPAPRGGKPVVSPVPSPPQPSPSPPPPPTPAPPAPPQLLVTPLVAQQAVNAACFLRYDL